MKRFLMPLVLLGILCSAHAAPQTPAPDWPVVARRGDTLVEGERPFRFFGLAAPNLHHNESQVRPDFSNRFPDEYELRDVLGGLQRLGGRATRMFGLTVTSPLDRGLPVYITARRTYNEEAFRCLDLALALCHEYDVRVIIPIIVSQSFPGVRGTDEFAALAGKTQPGAFWTDAEVKEDFRELIRWLMARRNTVNGLLYRDEPAILGWQLGNEFDSYAPDRKLDSAVWTPRITAWSSEMAAFIKTQDPHHLVIEAGGDRQAMLADPNIDVMSTHLYEYWNRMAGQPTDLSAVLRSQLALSRGKKPLLVDEFGLGSVENVGALMETIRTEGLPGGLLWGIRGHRRDGGFYEHNEGGTPVNSYHVPGFAVGQDYGETALLDTLRRESYAIRGLPVPPLTPPSPAPVLHRTPTGFTWRGSTGATHYVIERSAQAGGPWEVRADALQDATVANVKDYEASGNSAPVTLWTDMMVEPGKTYFYRVRGINTAGATAYSEVVSWTAPASKP